MPAGPKEVGVFRTVISLCRAGQGTSCRRVCRIMKENGPVVPSEAKSRRLKWVRYERKRSNSMRHTYWRAVKDPRMKGVHLVTLSDDASMCATGAGLFG